MIKNDKQREIDAAAIDGATAGTVAQVIHHFSGDKPWGADGRDRFETLKMRLELNVSEGRGPNWRDHGVKILCRGGCRGSTGVLVGGCR